MAAYKDGIIHNETRSASGTKRRPESTKAESGATSKTPATHQLLCVDTIRPATAANQNPVHRREPPGLFASGLSRAPSQASVRVTPALSGG